MRIKTTLCALLALALAIATPKARAEENADLWNLSPMISADLGVITTIAPASEDGAFVVPTFSVHVISPVTVQKLFGFVRLQIGTYSAEDALSNPQDFNGMGATIGLLYPIGAQDFPSGARLRTFIGGFVGGKTPYNDQGEAQPRVAKTGGACMLFVDLASGSWVLVAYGVDEEGLPVIPEGVPLPEDHYGWGQVIVSSRLRVPGLDGYVWLGFEFSVHVSRIEGHRDIAKASLVLEADRAVRGIANKLGGDKGDSEAEEVRKAALVRMAGAP